MSKVTLDPNVAPNIMIISDFNTQNKMFVLQINHFKEDENYKFQYFISKYTKIIEEIYPKSK